MTDHLLAFSAHDSKDRLVALPRVCGFSGTHLVMAVVRNRQGDVLARAEGPADADKAQSLLQTLQSSAF